MPQDILEFLPGSRICRQGDACRGAYLILEGEVNFSKVVHDEPVELHRLGKGDFFGDVELAAGQKMQTTATAATICRIKLFGPKAFQAMLSEAPVASKTLLKTFFKRLARDNNQAMDAHATWNPFMVTSRMLLYLWRMQQNMDIKGNVPLVGYQDLCNAVKDVIIVSLQEIRGYVKEMEALGVIRVKGKAPGGYIEMIAPKRFKRTIREYNERRTATPGKPVSRDELGSLEDLAGKTGVSMADLLAMIQRGDISPELVYMERDVLRRR